MDRYIGVDAHQQSCTFAVMSATGKKVCEKVVETEGAALRSFVLSVAGTRHICLEESELSNWLYELLVPLAKQLVVVQPERRRGKKSDSVDAWSLAEQMRTGRLSRAVYKAPGRFSGLRAAVRAHQIMMRDQTRAKNQLRAVYRTRGIKPEQDIYDPQRCKAWLQQLPKETRRLAELLGERLESVSTLATRSEEWLLEEAQHCPVVKLIATAPGIAEVRASQIVATVLTPYRFRTKRQLWSYCGLAVVTHSSSDWTRDQQLQWVRRKVALPRGLNRNRNPLLKEVFKGAAESIASRMPNHPLGKNYQRLLAEGKDPTVARLTIARQLAAAVLAMWKKMEPYDPARHDKPKAA